MINLQKGGRINLSKDENGNKLNTIFFGSNWGARKKGIFGLGGFEAVDLDSSVITFDENKCPLETVYFGHRNSMDGAIYHSGDDLTGDINGNDGMDNEVIKVELDRLSPKTEYVVFILNSFRHHKFDQIPYMGMRIYTTEDNRPVTRPGQIPNILAKYNLEHEKDKEKDSETIFKGREGMVLGYAYRRNGDWKFKALGNTGAWESINEIKRVIPSLL